MEIRRRNHPGTAAVLSFFFTGLGQVYNGQIYKGLVLMAFSTAAMAAVIVSGVLIGFCFLRNLFFSGLLFTSVAFFLLGTLCIALAGGYSIVDAYRRACRR